MQQVIYNGTKVPFGGLIPFDQAGNRPILKWDERDAFYTIIMTDPDSPSRSDPRLSELQHWIIGNVYRRNISSGETFAEYTGPRDAREFVVEEDPLEILGGSITPHRLSQTICSSHALPCYFLDKY
ncbi:protein D1 isoform X3 [Bemisia tabaci]|uniref:protein D1 isoform X3 n=1 Tax=Bemisia tabaci TaxID=7038 RepID=UPI003B281478